MGYVLLGAQGLAVLVLVAFHQRFKKGYANCHLTGRQSLTPKIHDPCPDNGDPRQGVGWPSVVVVGKLARALAGSLRSNEPSTRRWGLWVRRGSATSPRCQPTTVYSI